MTLSLMNLTPSDLKYMSQKLDQIYDETDKSKRYSYCLCHFRGFGMSPRQSFQTPLVKILLAESVSFSYEQIGCPYKFYSVFKFYRHHFNVS